jgi:hypothetical protein
MNAGQRLNKEVKSRTDVIGIFPNERAVVRLVGSVLARRGCCRGIEALKIRPDLGLSRGPAFRPGLMSDLQNCRAGSVRYRKLTHFLRIAALAVDK